jgi:fused signal recognition particle receptor
MFGLLKKKLSKVVESISEKLKKKEEVSKKVEEKITKIEKEVGPEVLEEMKPEEVVKTIEEKVPEIKEEVKKIVEEVKPEVLEEKPKKGLFKKITEKVVKKITEKRLTEEELDPILEKLGTDLLEADVAYEVVEKIKSDLKNSLVGKKIKRGKEKEFVVEALKNSLLEILSVPEIDLEEVVERAKNEKRPAVLLFLGFNGSGKTTTIAKIGKWLMDRGYTCMFAAADSWRAAAIEQLEEHGKKLGVAVVKHKYGGDPAAIVYDGISSAKAKGINVLVADSAGRTHVNKNLIDELKKIVRVNKPDLKILVVDSLTGNDCPIQLRMFDEAVGVDAVILTKMDVNEKGGGALSVAFQKKPILFVGVGQDYSDIKEFDKEWFVNQLLS